MKGRPCRLTLKEENGKEMFINATLLIPKTVNGVAVNSAVEGLIVNYQEMLDYQKAVATNTDRITLHGPGAQGDQVIEIEIDTASTNIAADEVGTVLVNLPFARLQVLSINGDTSKAGSRLTGNIVYVLDRTTADDEADVFVMVRSAARWRLEHWVIDTSVEAPLTRFARTDTGNGTVS